MWVSTAFAQSAGGAAAAPGFDVMAIMPLVLIFVVFYFMLIRPQQKKMKEHSEMISAVRRGDRVVTGGGILGTVIRVGPDDEVTVEIAEGVRVKVLKATINMVLSRTEPAKAKDDGAKESSDKDK